MTATVKLRVLPIAKQAEGFRDIAHLVVARANETLGAPSHSIPVSVSVFTTNGFDLSGTDEMVVSSICCFLNFARRDVAFQHHKV